jgi:tripartite-type tricarboxylate transporter receptor subunit TctC
MKFRNVLLLALTGLASIATVAKAQDTAYPNRIINIVSPFPAGGMNDVVSRIVGERLNDLWKQPVVIDNRAGANGGIGAVAVSRAPGDGYMLLMANGATHGSNPALYPKLGYDAIKDFKAVANVTSSPIVLVVSPNSPLKTVDDLIKFAKANPDKVSFGSSGVGSTGHITGESFNKAAGIKALHIPYRGDTPAVTDVMSGNITMAFITYGSIISQLEGGSVRALAKATDEKSTILPNIPTMTKLGYKDMIFATWFAIMAPAGTPDDVVSKLNTGIRDLLRDPSVVDRLAKLGAEPQIASPKETAAFVDGEIDRMGRLVKDLQISLN